MALSFVGAGTVSGGSPGIPTGAAIGDAELLVIALKPSTSTPTVPAGENYTFWFDGIVGTGTQGVDAGPVRISVYRREYTATPAALGTQITATGGDVWLSVRLAFRKAAGTTFDYANAGVGTDVTSGVDFSTVSSGTMDVTVGDIVVVGAGLAGDGSFTAQALTATGATYTVTERTDSPSTTGSDIALMTATATVTGTSTGTLTFTGTLPAAATGFPASAQTGGAAFARIRELAGAATSTPTRRVGKFVF